MMEKTFGLDMAMDFYLEYGAPMIHEKFFDYEDRIAVGLVGEGSECFGFDDEYSRDHDFGPGFCMWLTKSVYDDIGEALQTEYDRLPKSYRGITRKTTNMARGRVGVWAIGDFYEKYIGYRQVPETAGRWIDIDDYRLATVTNGRVFRDDAGIFSGIREQLLNMPESVRLAKLAREISSMSQTGQCNYDRSMARKDYVTAQICISDFMKHTLRCVFLLNKKYAPYYKWLLKGAKQLEILPEITALIQALADLPDQRENWADYEYDNTKINENDMKTRVVEMVAKIVVEEMHRQNVIEQVKGYFLGDYVEEIMDKAEGEAKESSMDKEQSDEDIIDEIIDIEFQAFDKVQNKDGRASCQNNWSEFYVMRKSQYLTWTHEMLVCIRDLWRANQQRGWNMITEKYARMMEHTVPEEYEQLKDSLPEKPEKTIVIVDQIAEIQVEWMKEFTAEYPKLADNARDITSDEDTAVNTSYETYLKGELLTYSDELIKLYAQFVVDLYRQGKNLARMTIENTVKLQGYESLEEAEKYI